MSYQVLALKYRPQTFEEVVGQEHVTTTLTNAISADRVAHAMLFTGPRGTGKTTIARILAKAMTCTQGPTPAPCNLCKICTDIIHGHCADVFEIDGASNNSVEQIRDLRENVTYMPASARFKIYIIDEVHMLSTAAFNALLKTLEEPPEHVLFIFATTEVHKIPATILSRCQRHDLARIPLNRISDHLTFLCHEEGFTVESDSLDLIALEADGSIRDSLSLLDRILSASPEKDIDHQRVVDNLGISDRQLMFNLSAGVFNKDGATLIQLVERINDSGLDLKKFYSDIIAHFRNLNIIKLCGKETPSLNLIDAEKEKLFETVSEQPQTYLGMLLQLLLDNENLVRFSSHTQTAVEMVLLKLIQINPGVQLDAIIAKLDTLARQIDTQPAAASTSGPPPQEPQPDRIQPEQSHNAAPPLPPTREPRQMTAPPPEPISAPAEPRAPENQEQQGPVTWLQFLNILQKKLPSIYAQLSRADIDTSDKDQITATLNLRSDYEKSRIQNKDKELQALSRQYLNKSIKFNMTTTGASQPQGPSESQKAEEKARQTASRHPMVQEARRLFDGEIL